MRRAYGDIDIALDAHRLAGSSPIGDTRHYGDLTELYPPGVSPANQARDTNTLQQLPASNAANIVDTRDTMQFGDFAHIGFTVGTANQGALLDRPQNKRTFLAIQNTHAVNQLFVGFGAVPSATIGFQINAGGTLLLDIRVPQNEVYCIGSAAGTTGTITYCNQEFGRV